MKTHTISNTASVVAFLILSLPRIASSGKWNPQEFDFIVVGGGTAGAAVAARLAEVANNTVLVLEAGKPPPAFNSIPYFSPGPFKGAFDWDFMTEKQVNCCQGFIDAKWPWPRGKGLGGSTLINSMAFSRGHKKDYDQWSALGNEGWSYKDLLPYFKKMESYRGPIVTPEDEEYHGKNGPLAVEVPPHRTPIADVFLAAGKELGYPNVDYNAKSMTGFANPVYTIKNGTRCSTYAAYLEPILKKENIRIVTQAYVTKVLLNAEKRAEGVLFEKDGSEWRVLARKEVILSAGTAQSPQLLMLSGIGPRETLEKFNIPVVSNLPGVGKNLMDHVSAAGVLFTIDEKVGFDRNKDTSPEAFELWETKRQGPLTVPIRGEGIAFLNSKYQTDDFPDFEIQFFQTRGNALGLDEKIFRKAFDYVDEREMFLIHPIVMRPRSVGYLTLQSANPHVPPLIQPRYMSDPYDGQVLREAVETSIKLMKTSPFQKLGVKWHNRKLPGCEKYEQFSESNSFWSCYLKHYSFGFYHQSGTCKMGPKTDEMAVVDSRLRVYGVKGLRVIDLSITPTMISGHTMGPAVMIGEKGAALVIDDWTRKKPNDEL